MRIYGFLAAILGYRPLFRQPLFRQNASEKAQLTLTLTLTRTLTLTLTLPI